MVTFHADFIDGYGRRYLEVPKFPDGDLKWAFAQAAPEECCECGQPVQHAFDRYYQRNDPSDGAGKATFEEALLALTYDTVCGTCGDKIRTGDCCDD